MTGKCSNVITINKPVYQVKENSHKHNGHGHFLSFGPEPERENNGSVYIMKGIKAEKDPGYQVMFQGTEKKKTCKHKQGRGFHDNPAPAVTNHCTPL
jgi:hypothetical protein